MKLIQTLLFSFFALQIIAGPISSEKALKNAKQFLKTNGKEINSKDLKMAYRCQRQNDINQSYYYVYNVGENDGFVIMSGEENSAQVLGHCKEGSFDINDIPDNLKWWLQYYEEAIKYISDHHLTMNTTQTLSSDVVEPLIATRWDQAWPYNEKCPEYNGAKCPTGCVATALAQLLYYYQFPTEQTKEVPGYQSQSINKWMPKLPAMTFDWGNMKLRYGMNSSQESVDAVAMLMLYCGQLVEMDYSPGGSGAQTDIIAQRLPQYFNYPKTMHSVGRMGYSIAEWDSLLINELKNNRPVLYTGYTSAFEGHAFICDGYDGNGLFHINWGWSGRADGDYRISVLDAKDNGIGGSTTSMRFSLLQSAIFGGKTEGEDEFVFPSEKLTICGRPSIKDVKTYKRNSATGNFTRITIAHNIISQQEKFQNQLTYGLCLYDDQGNMVKNIARNKGYLWPQQPDEIEYQNISFGNGVEDGHYTIRPVYSDGTKWVLMAGADKYYIDVQITGDDMVMTPVPKANFDVSSVDIIGRSLVVTLTNNDEEYNGFIALTKMTDTQEEELVNVESVAIKAGETTSVYIYLPDGVSVNLEQDVFTLTVDSYDGNYFYSNVKNTNAEIEKSIKVLNLSENDSTIIGDKAMVDLTITNNGSGEYRHFINMALKTESDSIVSDEFRQLIDVQPGEQLKMRIDLPIKYYNINAAVKAIHYVGKNSIMSTTSDIYNLEKGAVYWNADGVLKTKLFDKIFSVPEDALAINLKAAYSSDVKPNSNPNTIYMLNKSVPKGLKGRNIVNYENKGGNIVLSDGYDYYIPEQIQATNSITYKRTFTSEECGKWSTLLMPFKPEKITIDGIGVDWFHNASESNQAFWLQTLKNIQDDKAELQYADILVANMPYFLAINEAFVGKTVEFSAGPSVLMPVEKSSMSASVGDYTFVGTYANTSQTGVYTLNNNHLIYAAAQQDVAPFRAYLVKNDDSILFEDIALQGPDITDGIAIVESDHLLQPADVYTLSGVKVGTTSTIKSLPSGIYMVNGKKMVVR